MDYTTEDLKNMQDLQQIRKSLPLDFYHVIPGFETDHGILMTVSVPDVLPGATVNIKCIM